MDAWSKETLANIIVDEFCNFHTRAKEIENSIEVSLQKDLNYLRQLILQASDTNSAPLLLKTPKVTRGRLARRIEIIHEDETTDFHPISTVRTIPLDDEEVVVVKIENNDTAIRRSNRNASRKASKSIKALQSMGLTEGVERRNFNESGKNEHKTEPKKRHKQSKVLSSSDDEGSKPVEQKIFSEKSLLNKNTAGGTEDPTIQDETFVVVTTSHAEPQLRTQLSTAKRKFNVTRSPSPCHSNEYHTSDRNGPAAKKAHMIDDSLEKPNYTFEVSVYEDAIGKSAPIHNSTKIGNLTLTVETKLPESAKPLKNAGCSKMNASDTFKPVSATRMTAHLGSTFTISEEEDEESCTPKVKLQPKNTLLYENRPVSLKLTHKPNALFSPYATDSVKKRVKAFEQVHFNSSQSVDVDAPVRVTRTKTRAMAAATAVVSSVQPAPSISNIAQKLARKSLAKAKKISLAKQVREQVDDNKENGTMNSASKPRRIVTYNEKVMQMPQLRITPNTRSRLEPPPVPVGHGQTTLLNERLLSNLQHTKGASGSHSNVVVNMNSFLQESEQMQKTNGPEKRKESKRKATDDDARKKRDEALRAVTEEKRRKREEKELRIKLAREAKEKLDMEKRLRAEKEREERAKQVLQMHERQREEAEKKRLLQLQRAQEKEERRKQEEALRLQQLQEQEETERLLAEQRWKEQQVEKQHQCRLTEEKTQQRTAAEAAMIKARNQAKEKQMNTTFDILEPVDGPTSYKMDSEPDDDSDYESAPKHEIPRWARSEVRRKQLKLQEYIPMIKVYKFFGSRQCTPDLSEMFQGIDKRRLIRTSSAIWRKPPRASMLYAEYSS